MAAVEIGQVGQRRMRQGAAQIVADARQMLQIGRLPVATVETQQSFMNGFVSFFTLGIYAPQRLRVTCAS